MSALSTSSSLTEALSGPILARTSAGAEKKAASLHHHQRTSEAQQGGLRSSSEQETLIAAVNAARWVGLLGGDFEDGEGRARAMQGPSSGRADRPVAATSVRVLGSTPAARASLCERHTPPPPPWAGPGLLTPAGPSRSWSAPRLWSSCMRSRCSG